MNENSIKRLVHDINSKCSSLRGAAELLRTVSDKERKELLELMESQARLLAQILGETLEENGFRMER